MTVRKIACFLLLAIPLQAYGVDAAYCNMTASNLSRWATDLMKTQSANSIDTLQTKLYKEQTGANEINALIKRRAIYFLDKNLSVDEIRADLYNYCLSQ